MPQRLSPRQAYDDALVRLDFAADAAQAHAADVLEACYRALHDDGSRPQGVYLWGPVGRGKTWLMDRFHDSLAVPARRQHFHHFMRWVHRRQFQLSGTPDPLTVMARELGDEVAVLCLDELFVSDIADAMLLGRLMQVMFEQGVVLVTTSNQPPDQLYAEGYNRERFLPAIDAIQRHLQVLAMDGGCDHREHPGRAAPRYWVRAPQRLAQAFDELSDGQSRSSDPLDMGGRSIHVEGRCDAVLWCRYAQLCEQPLGALDFIGLCDRFQHILVGEVPALGGDAGAPLEEARIEDLGPDTGGGGARRGFSQQDDGARRFIALVDECYDRGVPLYIEAQVPIDALYAQGELSFAFRRVVSRLKEMQLARFGASATQRSEAQA
ncbi:cell division protein ZapE [Franzmannia pantelleriensis]|uniref:Cell division protein ZapE n=1 Tax=Franzmannia pantelleriensis TaxID=48727 RepID=A0A1G9I3D2_9GAMM|nr:cell division protein ZapE [Halomonas pantelleriensis]SDL19333.1 cell division protein ZapE [Halomonas pantelleriensis]